MSRGAVINTSETLIVESCYSCSVLFAMPQHLHEQRLEDRKSFWCPNGHAQHYVGKTEAERLAEEVDKLKRQVQYRDDTNSWLTNELEETRKQRTVLKGQLTRTKKRIANGVCPCCKRSFADLARHMAGQHPDYASTPEVVDVPSAT